MKTIILKFEIQDWVGSDELIGIINNGISEGGLYHPIDEFKISELTESTTKEQRINIVNSIINEIASYDRKFFYHKNQIAYIFERKNKLYYKCEWVSDYKPITEICLSIADYQDYKGWFHGGTLKCLIKNFYKFIKTGKPMKSLGMYHWGYTDLSIQKINEKAIGLGLIKI